MKIDILLENPELFRYAGEFDEADRIFSAVRPEGIDNGRWVQVLPYIMRQGHFHDTIDMSAAGVLVRNYDELQFAKESGFQGQIITDCGLYAMNREAMEVLYEGGAAEDTVTYEMSLKDIEERGVRNTSMVVYGRIPLMITAQCMYRNTHEDRCRKNSDKSAMPEKDIYITDMKDRKNVFFPVMSDCRYCYNLLLNSVPLSLHKELPRISSMGIEHVRLDFTTESFEEMKKVYGFFNGIRKTMRSEELNGDSDRLVIPAPPYRDYTKGHAMKGVE